MIAGKERTAGFPRRFVFQRELLPARAVCRGLDRVADVAEDRRDLAAEEDEGDDRDDGDEREDQRVLGQTLALLVPTNGDEELLNECHVAYLLNDDYPPPDEGLAN